MSVFSSVVLGLDGAGYVVMGACMLYPGNLRFSFLRPYLAGLYASVFKPLCLDDPEDTGNVTAKLPHELMGELSYRILAYLLVVLGFCRFILGVCLHFTGCIFDFDYFAGLSCVFSGDAGTSTWASGRVWQRARSFATSFCACSP
jgi:membrane associated rhomboid family serine protease